MVIGWGRAHAQAGPNRSGCLELIYPSFEYLQGHEVPNFSGQPFPGFEQPHGDFGLLLHLIGISHVPTPCCLQSFHCALLRRLSTPSLQVPSRYLQVVKRCLQAFSSIGWREAALSLSSYVMCSRILNILLTFSSMLMSCSGKPRTGHSTPEVVSFREESFPLQANSTLYAIYHKNVLLTHVQPAVCQNPQFLFCKAASQPVGTNPQHFMGLLNPGYMILIMAYVRDRAWGKSS